jgi:hypothetical protein
MDDTQADQAQAPLRAGLYGYLIETYDAAESVSAHLECSTGHAEQRGWAGVATFKDDGYTAFKEITRDGLAEMIAAIEAGQVDVVSSRLCVTLRVVSVFVSADVCTRLRADARGAR